MRAFFFFPFSGLSSVRHCIQIKMIILTFQWTPPHPSNRSSLISHIMSLPRVDFPRVCNDFLTLLTPVGSSIRVVDIKRERECEMRLSDTWRGTMGWVV